LIVVMVAAGVAMAAVVVVAIVGAATTTASAGDVSAFDVPAGVGARVPFTEYEAEGPHATTNGTVQGPDYTQGTVASEASGRKYVALAAGQYVEFTLTAAANAVDVAYNLPRGASGTLSIYVNGDQITAKLALTAKYSYLDTGGIGGSKTHHFFDDARVLLGTSVAAGGKVRLQADSGTTAANVDLADFENVGPPLDAPAGSISVTSTPYNADPTGAADATNAINQAVAAARAAGKPVWLPPGTFSVTGPLPVDNVTVQGAGPWYSVLHGTHLIDHSTATGPVKLMDFAAIGEVNTRNDGSPDNFIVGSLGDGSVVSNIWIQHQKVGLWLMGDGNTNLTIQNNRILDTTADAINFNGKVTWSTIKNNFIRNTGDDGIGLWSLWGADANDIVANNTVVQPNLANGIALYGGTDITLSGNVVVDTNALGSGIAISNQQFISNGTFSPLSGTITVTDEYLIRAGAMNPNWHHPMGAIRFDAYDYAFNNVTVKYTGGRIVDSPYSAIEIVGGDGTGRMVTGLTVDNVHIDGAGTVAIQAETSGWGTFSHVAATGIGVAGVYNCGYPPGSAKFAFAFGDGDSGLFSTVSGCDFPNPVGGGTGSTRDAPTAPVSTPTTAGAPPAAPGTPTTTAPRAVGYDGDLARSKPVTASGYVQTYVPANAVDGDTGTYWESTNNAFPQWIQVDLGVTTQVNTVVLGLPPSAAWHSRNQTLSIQGSTDGSSFRVLAGSATYHFDDADGDFAVANFATASVRFLRLDFTANSGWPAAQLSELSVYGPRKVAAPGAANLAAGCRVYAAGYTQDYAPAHVTDADPASYWESVNNVFPQTLTVDLGTASTVDRVVLVVPSLSTWGARTQTITVQGSVDGGGYTTITGARGYTFDPGSGNMATDSFGAVRIRFLRLVFAANTGWPAAQVSDLQVYAN
jgi:hypothetical protein